MADETNYGPLQNPESPYTDKYNAEPFKGGKSVKTKKKVPPNGELTILGSFDWKPKIDGKTEIDYLLKGKWSPSIHDFMEIAGPTPSTPGNLIALLGMITEFDENSIKRLNFITHADKTKIGIAGIMDASGVYFTNFVSDTEIENYAVDTSSYTMGSLSFTLEDVRKRFTSDAFFVLYGCKAGFDPTTLLPAFRNLFNITVIGFKEYIVFCPPGQDVNGAVFKRKGEKMGINKPKFQCDVDSTADWRSLINNPNAVKIVK